MKKFLIIILIIFLISSTALIKNSTKRIDDEIYVVKENIRVLKKDFENMKLENDYLSSAEKLLEYQNLYFSEKLFKKNIKKMMAIDKDSKKLGTNQLKLIND